MNIAALLNLSFFDAFLLVFVLVFVVYGFLKGIIRMIGELVGFLVGIWVAGHYFMTVYEWTRSLYAGYENVGLGVSFLLLLIISQKIISIGVAVLDKFFNFLAIIPFFGLINRAAGALFGFLLSGAMLGILIYFASRYSLGFSFDKFLVNAKIAPFLLKFGEFVSPLLPQVLRELHSLL
ncbi:MAG: CvpA family protein [bacterium]|nr:CvpA family protein [bacterium]